MTRSSPPRGPFLSNPLLLGFDEVERLLDQISKSTNEGYPPYNIERLQEDNVVFIRIILAVAGFSQEDLEIIVDENHLIVKGKQKEEAGRDFLHRGIAGRQFLRNFVLADGIEVDKAHLENGLLSINLKKTQPDRKIRKIKISRAN